jgi:hypothetical protein
LVLHTVSPRIKRARRDRIINLTKKTNPRVVLLDVPRVSRTYDDGDTNSS